MTSAVTGYPIQGYYPAPSAKPTSIVEKYGILPIHSSSDMEGILTGMVKYGQACRTDSFTGTIPVDVQSIMKNSAYVTGTEGSPGTILIAPGSEPGKFNVSVVNQLGDVFTCPIRKKAEGGWLNNSPGTVYPTFKQLTEHLLSTVVGVVGDCMGIQFFTVEQRNLAIEKLGYSTPGTYICFAHEPTDEFQENELPTKRNVLMWKTEKGIDLAFFHYDSKIRQWLNGGPQKPMDEEIGCTGGSISPASRVEILSDSTLGGLIGKKVRGPGIEPTPLMLDTVA